MLSSNVSVRVATLLKVRDKHLRHGLSTLVPTFLLILIPRYKFSCLPLLPNMSKTEQPQPSKSFDKK